MNSTIEVLENHGLIAPQVTIRTISKLPARKLCSLAEELQNSLVVGGKQPDDQSDLPFNFLASASLRGETGCSSPLCHVQKTDALARYAALFCDSLVVPLKIGPEHRDSTVHDFRYSLLAALISVMQMRPLIEANIVRLVASNLDFCPRCNPELVPAAASIYQVAEQLKKEHWRKFRVTKIVESDGSDALYINGPEEYIEHGQLVITKDGGWPNIKAGPIKKNTAVATGYIESLFDDIAKDVVLQQIYGVQFNARYLSDRPGEAELLARLNSNDQLATRTATLCATLSHRVPLLSEVPIERIIKIRRQDYTAFDNYRNALQKIIRDFIAQKKDVGDAEARDLFADILQPELLKMEVQIQSERKAVLKKSAAKIGATSLAVAVGAYAGLIPHQWAEIVKALGGISLLKDVFEGFMAASGAGVVRNNNLFFLFKLKQDRD